jgi:hypothetical protein
VGVVWGGVVGGVGGCVGGGGGGSSTIFTMPTTKFCMFLLS